MRIDWGWVASNAIWVLGLSMALTMAGFAHYRQSGGLARWRSGWWVQLISLLITLAGLLASDVALNWILIITLWIVWTVLDRYVFSKNS